VSQKVIAPRSLAMTRRHPAFPPIRIKQWVRKSRQDQSRWMSTVRFCRCDCCGCGLISLVSWKFHMHVVSTHSADLKVGGPPRWYDRHICELLMIGDSEGAYSTRAFASFSGYWYHVSQTTIAHMCCCNQIVPENRARPVQCGRSMLWFSATPL
jgi:hypothetical protein